MGRPAQDQEQHDALQRRLVELARMARPAGRTVAAGRGYAVQKTMPQGTWSAGPRARR